MFDNVIVDTEDFAPAIPSEWVRFQLEFDPYRKLWVLFAVAKADGEWWWFKGLGATRNLAFAALCANIANAKPVGEPVRPSRYVKNALALDVKLPSVDIDGLDLSSLDLKL